MRYAIFSDIHSNLEALEAVFRAYENEGIDKYLCVGDIVGYAANPKECIEFIRNNKITAIAGNHDWAVAGRFDLEWFNDSTKEAVVWTQKILDRQETAYLFNFEIIYSEDEFSAVHSSLNKPEEFHYLTEKEEVNKTFSLFSKQILFVGHTHKPGVFIMSDDDIEYRKIERIKLYDYKKYIVNIGSVGQPRDRDNRACFCIYDSQENTIEIKRIPYDIKSTQTKIINAGLPAFFSARLATGR